ncbi:unnamed protein product, partial [Didymodactylos carnosus]
RNINLGSLGSLLSGSNILSTLSGATHGTDLGTVLSILNTLNAVHQLGNDIHHIPDAINQTLQAILNGTSQAGVVLQQLLNGGITKRSNILSTLSGATHGTDLGTVLSILNTLNAVHQLGNDIHHIPDAINQTLQAILNGTSQAGVVLQQLLNGGLKPLSGGQ